MIDFSKFQEQAYRAFTGTSHSPERRAVSTLDEMKGMLEEDIAELEKAGVPEDQQKSYQARFETFFGQWLGKKSNCISTMIAGPSNFPVRRAQKANRSEENHWSLWMEWRKKAKKAIVRGMQPAKTYESEIDRYKAELKSRLDFQEECKNIRKELKKVKTEEQVLAIVQAASKEVRRYITPGQNGWFIPTWVTSNNLPNIKRIEGKIKELEAKEAMKQQAVGGEKGIPFEGGVLVLNYELDRVQIKYPGKPAPEVIGRLKSGGFRWAPSQMAWQRQLTGNGLYSASRLTGIAVENFK